MSLTDKRRIDTIREFLLAEMGIDPSEVDRVLPAVEPIEGQVDLTDVPLWTVLVGELNKSAGDYEAIVTDHIEEFNKDQDMVFNAADVSRIVKQYVDVFLARDGEKLLEYGLAIPENHSNPFARFYSEELIIAAAEAGHRDAYFHAGKVHLAMFERNAPPQNVFKASDWFDKAISPYIRNDEQAPAEMYYLTAYALREKLFIAGAVLRDDLWTYNNERLVMLYENAHAAGHPRAGIELAQLLESPPSELKGFQANPEKALQLYQELSQDASLPDDVIRTAQQGVSRLGQQGLTTTGDNPELTTTGDNPELATTGDNPELVTTGDNPELVTTGDNPEPTTTGDEPNEKVMIAEWELHDGMGAADAVNQDGSVAASAGKETARYNASNINSGDASELTDILVLEQYLRAFDEHGITGGFVDKLRQTLSGMSAQDKNTHFVTTETSAILINAGSEKFAELTADGEYSYADQEMYLKAKVEALDGLTTSIVVEDKSYGPGDDVRAPDAALGAAKTHTGNLKNLS